MANKPTAIIYLVQDTGKTDEDGRDKGYWHRIGAVFKTKSGNGSAVVWNFEPVPTNGRTLIMPYEEQKRDEADYKPPNGK